MDFSGLTNDQLVELIRAACAECVTRGVAVTAAAQAAMLSEGEKAQIAQQAARREAEKLREAEAERIARDAAEQVRRQAQEQQAQTEQQKQNRQWGNQKTLAQMVIAVLGSGWKLNVWNKDGEKRVYLDRGQGRSATGRVEYYHTGNGRRAPQTLLLVEGAGKETRPLVEKIVAKACEEWNSMQMECDAAAASKVEAVGEVPAEFIAFREVRLAAEAEAERVEEEKRREKASTFEATGPSLPYIKHPIVLVKRGSYLGAGYAWHGVARDAGDPARVRPLNLRLRDGLPSAFEAVFNSKFTPVGEWREDHRKYFTEAELALLADPAALPVLDYDAIVAAIAREDN